MDYFRPEPPYNHGNAPRIGIIISNLGTPKAANTKAVRRYLSQFLMDKRVVEIPRFIWCWVLYCVILVFRPKKSAKKYQQIWTRKGSPLMVNTKEQTRLLKILMRNKYKQPVEIALGMNYDQPSISQAFNQLRSKSCTKILLFPLYPQYAASSSAAAMDSLWRLLLKTRNVPEIRTIRSYHDHPDYINALKISVLNFWEKNGKPTKLVMSFHGIPKRSQSKGDPYFYECLKTGQLLAGALKLKKNEYQICFQSRFGRTEWLKPYFTDIIKELGKKKNNVHVICPGFSSDCLETLEEINMEGRDTFVNNGGKEYHYIPALNDNSNWIKAMGEIIDLHLSGWINPKQSLKQKNRHKLQNKT